MHPWLEAWGEAIPVDELTGPLAVKLTRQVGASSDGIAEIVGARRNGAVEVVVLDVMTGRPQRPVYDIKRVERVAVLLKLGEAPRVLALRVDFPDTLHQLLMPAPAVQDRRDRSGGSGKVSY